MINPAECEDICVLRVAKTVGFSLFCRQSDTLWLQHTRAYFEHTHLTYREYEFPVDSHGEFCSLEQQIVSIRKGTATTDSWVFNNFEEMYAFLSTSENPFLQRVIRTIILETI